jgi:hypothetical protein
VSKIIVARVAGSYGAQCGSVGLLGSPVLAKATQAEASRSAIRRPAARPDPAILSRTMWNEASTSWPCTAPNAFSAPRHSPALCGAGRVTSYFRVTVKRSSSCLGRSQLGCSTVASW